MTGLILKQVVIFVIVAAGINFFINLTLRSKPWLGVCWTRASMPPVLRCPYGNISGQTTVPDNPGEITNSAHYSIKG